MAAEEEVKLGGVSDTHIDGCASGYIATLACLVLPICAEEAGVVPLLYDDECDAGLVAQLQAHTCLTYGPQLIAQNLSAENTKIAAARNKLQTLKVSTPLRHKSMSCAETLSI